jgi:phosphoethanolamine N-methyltransferase
MQREAMAKLDKQDETVSMEFWGGKPATIAGMILWDESDTLGQAERADIIAQLPSLEGMEILELAAGIGRYTSHFAHVASHVTAVDFVEKFLDQNRKATAQFNNISYYCADVMDLEFEPESFDFIFMNWLLMYLDDQQMVLLRDRIRLWIRVGGTVFFRESCFAGASGGPSSKDNPARYRPDSQYTRLFEDDFRLLHRGNVKVYEQRFNNPYQCYWLFQRGP